MLDFSIIRRGLVIIVFETTSLRVFFNNTNCMFPIMCEIWRKEKHSNLPMIWCYIVDNSSIDECIKAGLNCSNTSGCTKDKNGDPVCFCESGYKLYGDSCKGLPINCFLILCLYIFIFFIFIQHYLSVSLSLCLSLSHTLMLGIFYVQNTSIMFRLV